MLGDFLVPVEQGGQLVALRVRDVPVGVFFAGFPDDMPGTPCWRKGGLHERVRINMGNEQWITGLLARVSVLPRLTTELVHRLGSARDLPMQSYFSKIGWLEDQDLPMVEDDDEIFTRPRRRQREDDVRALVSQPGKNLQSSILIIAARSKTAPHRVWQRWTISEFVFTWRLLGQQQRGSGATAISDPMLDEIGIEE